MKFSERWLREWVDPPVDTAGLVQQLTMAGLEVDGYESAAASFSGVVVGRVAAVEPHPNADKLTVCTVDAGDETLSIVCGAPNVRAGMLAPLARVGGELPGGMKIRKAKLRGVESRGMLCSARELGLSEDHSGIMDLPRGAPPGADLRDWLGLDDAIIDVDLTPNRGDCFSVLGIAREVALANDQALAWPELAPVAAGSEDTFPIEVRAPEACPRFVGRVIRGIATDAGTPLWMVEKLRRSGIRAIHPVVDVTNYVMLELGQPMHGFDLANLSGGIVVRLAQPGETLELLDGREVELDPDMLVIADHEKARALAGIMGGEASGVSGQTTDVFFEVAFFDPLAIAGRARRLGLHTDASLRFERGVDPAHQRRAVERATQLLISIAGGTPGPVVEMASDEHLPARPEIRLRRQRLAMVLGTEIPDKEVGRILAGLDMQVSAEEEGWRVLPPSHRFDVAQEVDLIEEVARIHGYDRIPEQQGAGASALGAATESRLPWARLSDTLVDRGYQEAVTFSFVDPRLQEALFPGVPALPLQNPISSELSHMRVSLWPGLLAALRRNLSRRQSRVRLFESGLRFRIEADELKQEMCLAGVIAGPRLPEQWGSADAPVDFFDAKSDVAALLAQTRGAIRVEADEHPALHPGQCGRVWRGETPVGWIGALHPRLVRELELEVTPVLWELEADSSFVAEVPGYQRISRFPAIRRDVAVVVDSGVPVGALVAAAREAAGPLLTECRVFDVYRGKGIDSGAKSVAFGLILQEYARTLTDADADEVVGAVVARLEADFGARLRD